MANNKNGKTAEVSEVSLSFAHNNSDIRQGFESGRISIYTTYKEKEYRLTGIAFNLTIDKYVCQAYRLTDEVKGKLKLGRDQKIKYVVKEAKPQIEEKPVEVKPEVKPVEASKQPVIEISFPSLKAIAQKLSIAGDEKALELRDRLNELQADLLDFFAGTNQPEEKPVETPKQPETVEPTKPEVEEKPETQVATEPLKNGKKGSGKGKGKRDTETLESKKQKWADLKAINALVKSKEMSASEAAKKYNMSPNSISAHLAAYRLCCKQADIKQAWIKGNVSWHTVRSAAQIQKMLGETLTKEVALGKLTVDEAKAKADA